MPLYTPWRQLANMPNRSSASQARALDGQQSLKPGEIGAWFEQTAATGTAATPFVWNGKAPGSGGGDGPATVIPSALRRAHVPRTTASWESHQKYRSTCQLTH